MTLQRIYDFRQDTLYSSTYFILYTVNVYFILADAAAALEEMRIAEEAMTALAGLPDAGAKS